MSNRKEAGPDEWLDLLMSCQAGKVTCIKVMQIIEQETVPINWVKEQHSKMIDLCLKIEQLPASAKQTELSVLASKLVWETDRILHTNYNSASKPS